MNDKKINYKKHYKEQHKKSEKLKWALGKSLDAFDELAAKMETLRNKLNQMEQKLMDREIL